MFEQAEIISSYSRAQALEDGCLIDVSNLAVHTEGQDNKKTFQQFIEQNL